MALSDVAIFMIAPADKHQMNAKGHETRHPQ
jgi:hypothetical protein